MKVLIVDDEVEVADFLCDFLRRFKLETIKATSGQEALDMFTAEGPDWVFLDVKMPDIDGLTVLRKLRDGCPEVKAMMITGTALSTIGQGIRRGVALRQQREDKQ